MWRKLVLASSLLGASSGSSRDCAKPPPAATHVVLAAHAPAARPSSSVEALAAGTPVRMYDGSSKWIEQVTVGDRVLSYSPERGLVPGVVAAVSKRYDAHRLLRV